MYQGKQVLIIGYGKMGRIYHKYLKELEITTIIYDPLYDEEDTNSINGMYTKWSSVAVLLKNQITDVILCSPTSTHSIEYLLIRDWFDGPILIEKPVTLSPIGINGRALKDPFVYHGMCERHNPAIQFLSFNSSINLAQATKIRFFRSSDKIESTYNGDLLIHDLDLLNWLFGQDKADFMYEYPKHRRELSFRLPDDSYVKVDLLNQIVYKNSEEIFRSSESPIRAQLIDFLDGNRTDAREAHELMFRILQNPHMSNVEYTLSLSGDKE